MSEPVGPIGAFSIACGSGAFSVSMLCAMGFDPSHLIAALAGCVIVQTFIEPSATQTTWSVMRWTIGSVLFAAVGTPIMAPWAIDQVVAIVPKAPPSAVVVLTAAALAATAQPLVGAFRKTFIPWLLSKLRRLFATSSGGSDV